jgi:putative ABC transport system permease protein
MTLLVRSRAPSDRTIQDTQSLLTSIDPHLQGFFARTLTDHVGVSLLPVRVAASLTTIVAALALGLAVIGLYSLVSFLVAERRSEIGLRIALGADRSDILRMVVGYGVKLALAGLVVGVPIAFVSTRLLRSLLYGVSPTDPFVFVTVSLAVVLVAAIACSMPAARAMRLDPMQALRRS